MQPSHRNTYRFPTGGWPLQPITGFPESGLFIEEPTLSPDGRSLACRCVAGISKPPMGRCTVFLHSRVRDAWDDAIKKIEKSS